MKKVVCFDPGYDRLGWAVGELDGKKVVVLGHDLIQTDKNVSWEKRLANLQQNINQIIQHFQPDEAAIEQVFFSKNTKTALKIAEVRGLIESLLISSKIKIHQLSPQAVKLAATGHGSADKLAVRKMVGLQLNLDTCNLIDDTIDALAMLLAIPS